MGRLAMPNALHIRTVYSDDHFYDRNNLNRKYDEGHRADYYADVNNYQYNNYYHGSKLQFSMVELVAAHLWSPALPRGYCCLLLLLQEGRRGQEGKEVS